MPSKNFSLKSFARSSQSLSSGFTLIELLIVISLLAIMSGILLSVLNPESARNKAKEGVAIGNISKLSQTLEAFYVGEGRYPNATQDGGTSDTEAFKGSKYIKTWPGDEYKYFHVTANPPVRPDPIACVSTAMPTTLKTSNVQYIKYVSSCAGLSGACTAAKIMVACQRDCSSFASMADNTGCKVIN